MRQKHIFIGSAGESKPIAERVAQELDEKGFLARRWWREFPGGSYTLERLRELAKEVDGAILIGTGVDVVNSRSIETSAPRDNVILEYGLFVGTLGRERCLLAIDGDAKLPSDVLALTNIPITKDTDALAEKIAKHFTDLFSKLELPETDGAVVVADSKIVDMYLEEYGSSVSRDWHQRHLYYGPDGAINWLRVSESSWYLGKDYFFWIRQAAIDLSHRASPRTFVSFGPGDARVDSSVIRKLVSDDKSTIYIPVDISEPLLHLAIGRISEYANVPVGIFGDFEQGLPFIYRQVRQYAKSPILYSLLGGTLGNFDDSEEGDFLHGMKAIMGQQDRLMIQVSIAGAEWSEANDPKTSAKSLDRNFKQFICKGVAKRFGLPIEDCVADFDKKIEVKIRESQSTDNTNHLYIEYWWTYGDERYMCTRICRYSHTGLIVDLEKAGFSIVESSVWPSMASASVRFIALLLCPCK